MNKLLALLILMAAGNISPAAVSRPSAVLRPAPGFTFRGVGKGQTLASLRGQSVVLLIANSHRERALRKQLNYLREIYQQFASKQVVFVAALKEGEGPIESDIPFVVVNNGPAVAAAYGAADFDFTLVIIGRDGNIDYQTTKVCTGERVRDVIQNSFAVQAAERR